MKFRDPGKDMTWPQYVAWRESRMSGEHERAETADDQTEEPLGHDDIHPSTIDPWPEGRQ